MMFSNAIRRLYDNSTTYITTVGHCKISIIMPTPLIGGGIKRRFCLTSDVCVCRVHRA